MLRICVFDSGDVKTVVAYPIVYNTDIGGEIRGTTASVWVEKEQGMVHTYQFSSAERPVCYSVVLVSRRHIVDVLRIVVSAHLCSGAYELTGLENDIANVAAHADSGEFPRYRIGSVHNNRGDAAHTCVTLTARLALYQTGK